jgi:hypothetical protein
MDLQVSSLYLLAAPSTPEPVREEILEQARMEKVKHADVKKTIAEARQVADGATGATPQLETRTGADGKERKQPTSEPTAEVLATRAATADRIRTLMGVADAPERDAAAQHVGPASTAELERLRVRVDELSSENRRLERMNLALESEVDELKKAATETKTLSAILRDACSVAQQADRWPPLNKTQTKERNKLLFATRDLAMLAEKAEQAAKKAAAPPDPPVTVKKIATAEQWAEGFSDLARLGKPH